MLISKRVLVGVGGWGVDEIGLVIVSTRPRHREHGLIDNVPCYVLMIFNLVNIEVW